jgi:hypothetical protein
MGARASADRLVAGTHWLSDECDVLLSYYGQFVVKFT